MNNTLSLVLEQTAAAVSLLLMGLCGIRLLLRLMRVLRGQEAADGLGEGTAYAPLSALAAAAGIALLSRLMLYVLAYAMYRGFSIGSDSFAQSFLPLWMHWDTQHYVGIAQDGYVAMGDERLRLVFFPLYPALMRLLAPLMGGNVFYSGVVVSLACASLSAALVYDLAYMHGGKTCAARAAAYYLLCPLSVFLCCVYTESLFICLTLLAVCLLRRGHAWLAALCGMLSALTRMPGVIIAGLLIIALLEKIPKGTFTPRAVLSCVFQVLIVFSGLFLYWLINWLVTGDPMTYLTYQRENWYQEPGSFWQSTANTMHYFLDTIGDGDWLYTWGFQLLCMLGIYLLLALRAQALPFDLAAYSFVYVAVVLSPTWLLSAPRYLYALCALPLMLAQLPLRRRGHGVMMGISAVWLAVWVFGYTIAVEVL
ncbi:MAG: hypothetical protein IKK34_01545 [Clostridia bacterium]|nr:hypothetical protein [Clostridia bacterium]